MRKLWRAAVREFVIAASEHIPVKSGMSKSSLLPLAGAVRARNALESSIQGNKTRGHGQSAATYGYSDNIARYKSRALGERLGKNAYNLEYGNPQNPRFKFRFDVPVLQWHLYNAGIVVAKGTSDSTFDVALAAGKEAFENFISEHFTTFVRGNQIIKVR